MSEELSSREKFKQEKKQIEEGWGAQIVSSYTREDAIEDGVLIDVTKMGGEAGFKIPVAITARVHTLCTPDKDAEAFGQSYAGRLWDVLSVARFNALKNVDSDRIYFQVKVQHATSEQTYEKDHKLWARITPEGRNYTPVLTIMCQGED